jgi:hypothetical protein
VVSSSFAIGDVRFAIRSTSGSFGAWVRETLGAYEVEDVEDFLYSIVVPDAPVGERARSKDFCILYKGSSAILRTLDPMTAARGLLAEVEALRFHERDDAVYALASVLLVRDRPVLMPSTLVPSLSKVGRRLAAYDVRLPGSMTVAIDPESAALVPVAPSLGIVGDALERLDGSLAARGPNGLVFVDEPVEVSAFLVPAREAETPLRPAAGGYALASLANRVLNFERVGGRGLRAIGRLVERALRYEVTWTDTTEAMRELSSALGDADG